MAEVQQLQRNSRRGRRPLPAIRVDMTPMVDLAFLLLTFFVLTAELSKEHAITATFPPQTDSHLQVRGLTVLLGAPGKNIYWYRGEFVPGMHLNVVKTDKELLNVLLNANKTAFNQVEVIDRQHNLGLLNDANWNKMRAEYLGQHSVPFVAVKWNKEAEYRTVINTLNDLRKVHISKYAVTVMADAENELIK